MPSPYKKHCSLNGHKIETESVITYDMIRHLACRGSQPSVTYHNARFGKEGILSEGQNIEVVDGTRFEVMNTDNA
jgi:hypothetical protein